MSRAAFWFWATARNGASEARGAEEHHEGKHQDEGGADDPERHGCDPDRAEAHGTIREQRGERQLVVGPYHARPRPQHEREPERDDEDVPVSASSARRMMVRSTRYPSIPPTATPQARARGREKSGGALRDQATNAETMSISPWAKFSVRVAL